MDKNQRNDQQGKNTMPGRGKQDHTIRKADSAKKSAGTLKEDDKKNQQGSRSGAQR